MSITLDSKSGFLSINAGMSLLPHCMRMANHCVHVEARTISMTILREIMDREVVAYQNIYATFENPPQRVKTAALFADPEGDGTGTAF